MSSLRNFVGLALATVFGVATAVSTLDPAFREQQRQKSQEEHARQSGTDPKAQAGGSEGPIEKAADSPTPSGLKSIFSFRAWERGNPDLSSVVEEKRTAARSDQPAESASEESK